MEATINLVDAPIEVLRYVAKTSSSEDVLNFLAVNPDEKVRMNVAENTNTSDVTLATLSKDTKCYVRHSVACNPKCSGILLTQLADDPALMVQQTVAKNPITPEAGLLKLIAMNDFRVNDYLALNPNITPSMEKSILEQMIFDWERKGWYRRRREIGKL